MMSAEHYTYRIRFSAEDNEHVATVVEFPSLSWLAENPADAFSGILNLVSEVIRDLSAHGEPVPVPIGEREYSGRFNVRIPPEAHRELVTEAAEQGISLNR
ncbi:MAG: type II toxin-antitoxin system HicB family antitoxin [Cellulomonadaceae bacterium]|jgi:predicted HicB family RNase H-like nuclease|nr:type II toxin-antitoxin system HicB family antitoxin [Cellulomonadaceae bacterium]